MINWKTSRSKRTTSVHRFGIKTMRQYQQHYLLIDVLLLADVFQHFREAVYSEHNLDCLHFITLPSLAWQMVLKHTKVGIVDRSWSVFNDWEQSERWHWHNFWTVRVGQQPCRSIRQQHCWASIYRLSWCQQFIRCCSERAAACRKFPLLDSRGDQSVPVGRGRARFRCRVSEWVSSCLTAHQHNTGYSVPLTVECWNDLY